jgi:hypothetical protein
VSIKKLIEIMRKKDDKIEGLSRTEHHLNSMIDAFVKSFENK